MASLLKLEGGFFILYRLLYLPECSGSVLSAVRGSYAPAPFLFVHKMALQGLKPRRKGICTYSRLQPGVIEIAFRSIKIEWLISITSGFSRWLVNEHHLGVLTPFAVRGSYDPALFNAVLFKNINQPVDSQKAKLQKAKSNANHPAAEAAGTT